MNAGRPPLSDHEKRKHKVAVCFNDLEIEALDHHSSSMGGSRVAVLRRAFFEYSRGCSVENVKKNEIPHEHLKVWSDVASGLLSIHHDMDDPLWGGTEGVEELLTQILEVLLNYQKGDWRISDDS